MGARLPTPLLSNSRRNASFCASLWERRFLGGCETTNCTAWGFIYTAFTIDSDEARLDGHAGLQSVEGRRMEKRCPLKRHPVRDSNSSNSELGKWPESILKRKGRHSWVTFGPKQKEWNPRAILGSRVITMKLRPNAVCQTILHTKNLHLRWKDHLQEAQCFPITPCCCNTKMGW